MPYIAIKAYPKDEETKKKAINEINEVLLRTWGCPQEAISISVEEFAPSDWNAQIRQEEIEGKKDKMMILDGKKLYE